MKLNHVKSVFYFEDESGNEWIVEFSGKHGNHKVKIFKNQEKKGEYVLSFGHANKTQASEAIMSKFQDG